MSQETIVVINAGSSSLKFSLFATDPTGLVRRAWGQIEDLGGDPKFSASIQGEKPGETLALGQERAGHHASLDFLLEWLAPWGGVSAAGHRVVHGGIDFSQPVVVNDEIVRRLEKLIPLAPLHQPHNLDGIRAMAALFPQLLQVACFDTAFHATKREEARFFPLPGRLADLGVCRYGFHGLSYEYIAGQLPVVAPEIAQGRVVVAHLGNGASMCAMHKGRAVDSTMGMTAADGLPMGTRSGSLDPGVVLFLAREMAMPLDEIEHLLYHESGLKGVSGLSHDMRILTESSDPNAQRAIDLFVYRIQQQFGALAASLGGLDGVVFTAGIGEHSSEIRQRILAGLSWLGLELDGDANQRHGPRITTPGSRVSAWVVPTNEERMIAQHTLDLFSGASGSSHEDLKNLS